MTTRDSLLKLRTLGDPLAEDLLNRGLEKSGHSAAEVMKGLRKPLSEGPHWLSRLLGQWVSEGPDLPLWANPDLMDAGRKFFDNFDLAICTALFNASLPSAYAGAQGVHVLTRVSQLAKGTTVSQRIAETGQMLLDITEPGTVARGSVGYPELIRVRMLHAAIRAVLLGANPPGGAWQESDGVPINQEDLLATLTTFTVTVFRSLNRMGLEVPVPAQEAYLHLWAVAGTLLGVGEAQEIRNPQGAKRLTTELEESLQAPSADGAFLMAVLLDEMEFSMPLGLLRLPRTLVRFLVGDRVAHMLQVPSPAWWAPALPVAATLNRRLNRYPLLRHIGMFPSHLMGRRMIQRWIDEQERGERHPFSVRADRRQRWRIGDGGTAVAAMRRRLRARRQRLRKSRARIPPNGVGAHSGAAV